MKDNKPSQTALLIAKATVLLAENEELSHLVPKEAVEPCLWCIEQATGNTDFRSRARSRLYNGLIKLVENLMVPGIVAHYALRKQYLQQHVERLIQEEGVTQFIILAGGYDTLAYRMSRKYPETIWIEIDHPATMTVKKSAYQIHGALAENQEFHAVDLSKQSVTEALETSGIYSKQRKTALMMEGLTMYLSEDAIHKLFDEAAVLADWVLFTYINKVSKSVGDISMLSNLWLSLKKEPNKWGIQDSELQAFLGSHQLTITDQIRYAELQSQIRSDKAMRRIRRTRGEQICISRRFAA